MAAVLDEVAVRLGRFIAAVWQCGSTGAAPLPFRGQMAPKM
jgi:hypothetical protein